MFNSGLLILDNKPTKLYVTCTNYFTYKFRPGVIRKNDRVGLPLKLISLNGDKTGIFRMVDNILVDYIIILTYNFSSVHVVSFDLGNKNIKV